MFTGIRKLLWFGQVAVALAVAFLTANYFYHGGAGFGFNIPREAYEVVLAMVLLGPGIWMCTHVCQGAAFGMVGGSGGLWSSLKMAFAIGLMMGMARLWMPLLGVALGCWLGGGPKYYSIPALVSGVLLLLLHRLFSYFWREAMHPSDRGVGLG